MRREVRGVHPSSHPSWRRGIVALTVLVVDDEPTLRNLLADTFAEVGFHVRAAADGIEALSEAERERPDVVVSDVVMPGLDGAALADLMRERGVPVILLSAVYDAVDLPGVSFLPKPFDLDELLDVVASVLETGHDRP
jgi:DNA-binding response OmpR family regulator